MQKTVNFLPNDFMDIESLWVESHQSKDIIEDNNPSD